MPLVKILNEDFFFEKVKKNSFLRPSDYSAVFLKEGSIQFEINGETVSYEKGHIILISPQNIYNLLSFSGDLKVLILIHNRELTRDKIDFSFNRYDAYRVVNAKKNQNIFKPSRETFDQFLQLMDLLLQFTHPDQITSPFREQKIISVFSTITYLMMESLIRKTSPGDKINSRKEDITINFIELVIANAKMEKQLIFYANTLHISIKYLSICVKEMTNTAPTVFITQALLNEARTMLISTNNSISGIAEELNFSDQFAFGKFFKKQTGISPRNYRKKSQLTNTI